MASFEDMERLKEFGGDLDYYQWKAMQAQNEPEAIAARLTAEAVKVVPPTDVKRFEYKVGPSDLPLPPASEEAYKRVGAAQRLAESAGRMLSTVRLNIVNNDTAPLDLARLEVLQSTGEGAVQVALEALHATLIANNALRAFIRAQPASGGKLHGEG